MITSYDIAEYITCPKRAYILRNVGCSTVHMAAQVREYLRIMQAFRTTASLHKVQNAVTAQGTTVGDVITHTHEHLKTPAQDTSALAHAIISADGSVAAYVPLCTWNASHKAWDLHFPATAGLRLDHKIYASCAHLQCRQHGIPLARTFLQNLVVDEHMRGIAEAGSTWHAQDISSAVQKYCAEFERHLAEFIALLTSANAHNESAWKTCGRRYCDVCKTDQSYAQDDVRTLRKSKSVVDNLLECGITRIQDIPPQIEMHISAQRQVQAVRENKRLFYTEEIHGFLHKLSYPRYYLDFEGISTTVPFFGGIKVGGFVPFLFSLQWQKHSADSIHTHLWGMPPAVDKRLAMWQQLKTLLKDAQSIIVYSRNFEDAMIQHLSQLAGEAHIGESIRRKIVDLQDVFFYLSVYDPLQKGKISLKTLTSILLHSDYSSYTVQDGMEANYFFTAMSDKKRHSFAPLCEHPAFTALCQSLDVFDAKRTVTVRDIAEYCKYDTTVMIRLVSLLEHSTEF